ncbi:hypothetical protein L6255_04040 [Candidatus Parcubacteria bacterium]|nr:hypothetical protein [Patescibacteria group bacterium]MBU4380664.1 hypothetical protein [Patescibacteria group bacterium]MCG2689581.1 hypothetical protein [Candidatus Parcubacteria bacterium]
MNFKKILGSVSLATATALSLVKGVFAAGVDLSIQTGTFPTGSQRSFGSFFSFAIRILFALGGILMLVFLIMGGIRYITSGGDKLQAQGARDMITNALIGIIIIAASYAIATLLNSLFGIDIFNATISIPMTNPVVSP